jgi:glutathione peroxidase-family protein
MKLVITLLTVVILNVSFITSSIYSYSIPKIEGGTQEMNLYQGKRVLIVVLPVQQSAAADTMLYCLDTLALAHIANLSVIGVPAYEDGYSSGQQTQLKDWYRSKLGSYITISNGLYTRKSSGGQQHGLFQWLTKDSLNNSFDIDVSGPGNKFFVSAAGELFGVLAPQSKISGPSVQATLQIQ